MAPKRHITRLILLLLYIIPFARSAVGANGSAMPVSPSLADRDNPLPEQNEDFLRSDKGPLHITGQTPLQTFRLNIVPSRDRLLRPGEMEFSLINNWTNRFNQGEWFVVDMEVVQNEIGVSLGLFNNIEVGMDIPVITRFGGILDGFISDFHKALGMTQGDRNNYPNNDMSVKYRNSNGQMVTVLDKGDAGTIMGDVSLHALTQVYKGNGWIKSLIFSSLLRLPTSTELNPYASGGIDGAFAMSSEYHLTPFYLYTTIGYGIFGSVNFPGIDVNPYQWTFFAAAEYPVNPNISVIVQQYTNSALARNMGEFSDPSYELTMGVKQYVSPNILLEYGLVENILIFDNSNDIGFHFGINYRP